MRWSAWVVVSSSLTAGASPLIQGTADATLQSNQAFAYAGQSVAGAGDVNGDGYADVIVGASSYDAGQVDEGAAFIFLGGPAGISNLALPAANTVLQGDQAGAFMGKSVAGAGDVNGDGYDDVIVGAFYYDGDQPDEGMAFVYHGGPSGISSSPAAGIQSNQANAGLGISVAGVGDVNADGYDDVVVGAVWYDAGETDEGAAFLVLGTPLGAASYGGMFQTNQANARVSAVARAGDVNADGYADVLVGSSLYDAPETDEGAAFVLLGGPSGIAGTTPASAATLRSNQADARLGWSAASAGDVNRDGYGDVIVGAPDYDAGQSDEGAAFVFLGGPSGVASGTPATAHAVFQSNQEDAGLGSAVAGVGDVTGDGFDDVIVGADGYAAGQEFEGAAFVFRGGPSGVASATPASAGVITLQANVPFGSFGASVAPAGDVNGDGHADVIVGAYRYEAGENQEGAAFVYHGGFVKGDLNRDLKTDLVLRYQPTGENYAWTMNGVSRLSEALIVPTPADINQRVVGIDDFNGNLHNDLLIWNQATGATEFWPMLFSIPFGPVVPLAAPAPPWKPSATADFNHDGKPDIVWRDFATQKISIWTMNGMVQQGAFIPTPDQAVDANWEIVAALDWNGDKNTDFLWYNATSGKIVLWFMNANAVRITGQFTNPPNAGDNNWNVVAAGDYGVGPGGLPGTKDIVWRNATSGNIVVWYMDKSGNRTSGTFTTPAAPSPGPTNWAVVGPR